jgi:hypothetical protein
MIAIAVANGALREALLTPRVGGLRAHQLSTLTAILFFGVYIAWLMRRWRPATRRETVGIGALWLLLTVLFEFGMGRLLLHREWTVLLADYNLAAGHLWPLLLVWVAVAPTVLSSSVSAPSHPR